MAQMSVRFYTRYDKTGGHFVLGCDVYMRLTEELYIYLPTNHAMRYPLLFNLICLIVIANINQSFGYQTIQQSDSSKYVILKFEPNRQGYPFNETFKEATLSRNEITKIDSIVSKKIITYNLEVEERIKNINAKKKKGQFVKARLFWDLIAKPSEYYRQIICSINTQDEKVVWVNYFCSIGDEPKWRKNILRVLDGGSCYFNLKINLKTNTIYEFMSQGTP